jgi:Phasin protein
LEGPAVAEPLVLDSRRAHRSIFPVTTKCLAFALYRVLCHCNILLRCTIKGFTRQAATNASVAADAGDDTSSAKEIDMAETDEDPLAATGEDPVVETGKASVIKTAEASVAKNRKAPVAETRKAFVVETKEDHPTVETSEDHPVVMDFENPQNLGNGGVEAAASVASSFAGSFQMFADEATDYSKKSLESGSAFIEKLRCAKSLESAIQIQSDYAKSAYAEFLAYLVKMSDLYMQSFQTRCDANRKSGGQVRGRQDIGVKHAGPGAMEPARTLAKI